MLGETRPVDALREWFAPFDARIVQAPLFDFSRLNRGTDEFCEVSPRSTAAAAAIVQLAAKHEIPLRVRGNGHALNGASLPRPGELVLNTRNLDWIGSPSADGVEVGAGAIVWAVDARLRAQGWSLPVVNDGYPGPTVGGYVAAGGFGPGSRMAGGFWENVAQLTIVDGHGRVREVARSEPLFPWFFGAMGQLAIITGARLDVKPGPPARSPVAVSSQPGPSGRERAAVDAEGEAGKLFWFTLFVPDSSLDHARGTLDALEARHRGAFTYRNRYAYPIQHMGLVAPLLWPHPSSFHAVGSWGMLEAPTTEKVESVLAFEAEFGLLAFTPGYRRYIQSEVPAGVAVYERYFGPEVYGMFRDWKGISDPEHLFNRGTVFAPPSL